MMQGNTMLRDGFIQQLNTLHDNIKTFFPIIVKSISLYNTHQKTEQMLQGIITNYIDFIKTNDQTKQYYFDENLNLDEGCLIICNLNNYSVKPIAILDTYVRKECWVCIKISKNQERGFDFTINGFIDPENQELMSRYTKLRISLQNIYGEFRAEEEKFDKLLSANFITKACYNLAFLLNNQIVKHIDLCKIVLNQLLYLITTTKFKKAALKDIIFFINEIRNDDATYMPNKSIIKVLGKSLSDEFYIPKIGEDDLSLKVIDLIYNLKDSSILNTMVSEPQGTLQIMINNYFGKINKLEQETNYQHYTIKQLDFSKESFEFNPRSEANKSSFKSNIIQRMFFLKYQATLSHSIFNLENFLQLFNNIDNLSDKKREYQKLKEKQYDLNKPEVDLVQEKMDDAQLRIKLQKEIDYLNMLFAIYKEVDFEELIVAAGDAVESCAIITDFVSQDSLKIKNKAVAIAIVKILKCSNHLPDDNLLNMRLENIIPHITNQELDLMLNLSEQLRIKGKNIPNLLDYIGSFLINEENTQTREKAYNMLRAYDNNKLLAKDHLATKYLRLEQLSRHQSEKLEERLQFYKDNVNNSVPLTISCFNDLSNVFTTLEQTSEEKLSTISILADITEQLINTKLQKIPASFTENFCHYTDNVAKQSDSTVIKKILRIIKALTTGDNINLEKVKNIINVAITRTEYLNDSLDIIFTTLQSNRASPALINEISLWLEPYKVENRYIDNILKFIKKENSPIELNLNKLKNQKLEVKERIEALNLIVKSDYNNSLQYIIDILVYLIKHEQNKDLKSTVLDYLIKLLPDNYQETSIHLDLSVLSIAIYNNSRDLDKIVKLAYKDLSHQEIGTIIDILIHDIHVNELNDQSLGLLEELLLSIKSKNPSNNILTKERIENIFEKINYAINLGTKKKVCGLFDNCSINLASSYLDSTFKKVKDVNCLSTDNLSENLQAINDLIKSDNYAFSLETIDLLIENLQNNEIALILLKIDKKQVLDNNQLEGIYNKVIANKDLIKDQNIIKIIIDGIYRESIDQKIANLLCEQFSLNLANEELHTTLTQSIAALASGKYKIADNVLRYILDHLENNSNINLKIKYINILSNTVKFNLTENDGIKENIIEIAKKQALIEVNENHLNLSIKLKLNSLDLLEENFNIQDKEKTAEMQQFLISYYNTLKNKLTSELSNAVDEYINNQQFEDVRSKYYFLRTLTYEFINNLRVGVDIEIFIEFHPNRWGKELLCSELLKRLISNEDEGINETILLKFRHNINKLYNSETSAQPTERALQAIIDIQQFYNDINFDIVNDTLALLYQLAKCNEPDYQKALNLIYDKNQDFYFELRNSWLKGKLVSLKVSFDEQELSDLNQQLLRFDSQLVNILLTKLANSEQEYETKSACIKKLINFLNELTSYKLSFDEEKQFMSQCIQSNYNIDSCLKKLFHKILEINLEKTFTVNDYEHDYSVEYLQPNHHENLIEAGKIYFFLEENTSEIKYKIKNVDNKTIDGSLSIDPNVGINLELLNNIKNDILKNLSKKGHINTKKIFKIKNQEEIDELSITKLKNKLSLILDSGWSVDSTNKLIESINNKKQFFSLCDAVEPIYDYEIKEIDTDVRGNNIFKILQKDSSLWKKEIHQLAIFNTFSGSHDKTLEELKEEILQENTQSNKTILQNKNLVNAYDQLIKCNGSKLILERRYITETANNTLNEQSSNGNQELNERQNRLLSTSIENWDKEDIRLWSKTIKFKVSINADISQDERREIQNEKIAVIKRAMELSTGFKVRDIQLLSLLILLNPEKNKGRLTQINTGEGKTTIVAMLAAIKVLEGHTVDIITSSPELARPQSEQQRKFFEILGITVSHNGTGFLDNNKQACYKAAVLYGAAGDFQGDILRDEYSKLGTRYGRKCDVAIVDEVDSMLIDGRNHIVMLSTPLPAMDYLEPLLAAIWIQVRETAKLIKEYNSKDYFVENEYIVEADGQIKEESIINLKPIEGTKRDFIKNATEKYIRKLIRDPSLLYVELKCLQYELHEGEPPLNLKPNNIYLYKINEKINYKFLNNQNKPIQDILEFDIKKVDINSDFLTRYRVNILNAIADKGQIKYDEWTDYINLENTGNVASDKAFPEIKIPKHLRNLVIEVQLSKWIDSAIYAKYECAEGKHYILLNEGRTIAPVDASNTGVVQQNMHWDNGLHQFLQIKHGAKITPESLTTNFISNVSFFKRYGSNIYGLTGTLGSEQARKLLEDVYKVDSIIIPPFRKKQYKELKGIITEHEKDWYNNIIETSINNLNQGRGVLVITEYIKVAEEIAKRLQSHPYSYDGKKVKLYTTSEESHVTEEELRAGEIIIATNIAGRGTDIKPSLEVEQNGGLHVCLTFLPVNSRVEAQNFGRTSRTGNRGTTQLILCSKLTDNLDLLRIYRNTEETQALEEAKKQIEKVCIQDQVFVEFCNLLDEFNNLDRKNNTIKAVEERFAIWLKMQKLDISDEKELLNNFKTFKEEILRDKGTDKLIKNPCYHVLAGNKLLANKNNKKAIEEFQKAIALDQDFQLHAYYNMGYARIAEYGNANQTLYVQEVTIAIKNFKKAKQVIENIFEPMLNFIQQASDAPVLSEQVKNKITLYNVQKSNIEHAIGIGSEGIARNEQQDIERIKQKIKSIKVDQKKQEIEKNSNMTDEESTKFLSEFEEKIPEATEQEIKQQQRQEIIEYIKENKKIKKPSEKDIKNRLEEIKQEKLKQEIGVIGIAQKNNNGLKIKLLGIKQSLPEDEDTNLYDDEIGEFSSNGFRGSFEIAEITPIPWWSIIGMMLLSVGQMVIGGAIAVFSLGAGSSIGMGLISEGVGDLITAVKDGIINRSLDWASWAIQKAISITVSIVCAGLGAIKDAAKTVIAGAKHIGQAVTQTVKEGWKLAVKAVGINLAKDIGKEIVTQLVDYGINKALMPSIEEAVISRVQQPIQEALLHNPMVEKLLKIDGKRRNNYYQNLIKQKALEILHPKDTEQNALLSITKGIAVGIAKQKVKGLSTILQIADAVTALDELSTFIPEFIKQMEQKITEIDNSVPKELGSMASSNSNLSEGKQQEISNIQHATTATTVSSNIMPTTVDAQKIDIDLATEEPTQATLEIITRTPAELSEILSSNISKSMCLIIQNKLIMPASQAGINFGMKKLTAGIDKSLQNQIGNFQSERRIHFMQSGDKGNRVPIEFKKFEDEKAEKDAMKKADKVIEVLAKDGEAGLPHLGALSDQAERPIEVYNEKGLLLYVIGEDKGGEPIKVEHHKNSDGSGHWTLPRGLEPPGGSSGKNNCLFDVVGVQTGQKGDELRKATVEHMSNNKDLLACQAADITRLEAYKSDALRLGGAINFYPLYDGTYTPEGQPTVSTSTINNDDGTYGMYHGTDLDNMESIMEKGLDPTFGGNKNSATAISEGGTVPDTKGKVKLATTPILAEEYAKTVVKVDSNKIGVLIEHRCPQSDLKTKFDIDSGGGLGDRVYTRSDRNVFYLKGTSAISGLEYPVIAVETTETVMPNRILGIYADDSITRSKLHENREKAKLYNAKLLAKNKPSVS